MARHPRSARSGIAPLLALLLVAGCGGAASPTPPATSTPTTPSSPTSEPTAAPSPTPTASPTPAPTPAPTATAEPTPAPTATPPAGFRCTYPYTRAGTTDEMTHITDVRLGRHAGYDRVVFDLSAGDTPTLTLERADPPFSSDPSDLPLDVPGDSFVVIRLEMASGEGYSVPDGTPTYTEPDRFEPGYARLASLVRAGDFEGHTTWIAGLTGDACHRVLVLEDPTRIAIDFQAP